MKVAHISFDYPDGINGQKTQAVKNLVTTQKSTDYVVFSLNRSSIPFRNYKISRSSNLYSLRIFGLPRGILLFFWMYIAYRRINAIIRQEEIRPDLIHAHKLTYEGIIAYLLFPEIEDSLHRYRSREYGYKGLKV